MRIKIKCEDPHNPQRVIEIDSELARKLVKQNPNYSFVNVGTVSTLPKKSLPDFSESMTEKQIKKSLKDNNINLDYNIANETKKDKLKQIEKLGFIIKWESE